MTPIAPLISSFLREHMPIEQGCSPHTCETYAHAYRLLFVFASKRLGIRPSQICLEQIDAALILDFLAHIEEQRGNCAATRNGRLETRSEEHTSELQSPDHLVCRLLLEKKKHLA